MKQGRLKMGLWGEDRPPSGQLLNLMFSDKLSVWECGGRRSDSFADMRGIPALPGCSGLHRPADDVGPCPLGENQLVLSSCSGPCLAHRLVVQLLSVD